MRGTFRSPYDPLKRGKRAVVKKKKGKEQKRGGMMLYAPVSRCKRRKKQGRGRIPSLPPEKKKKRGRDGAD